MSAELYFIYDSHCPWSYAATNLINEVAKALPNIKINFWHGAYFDGEEVVNAQQTLAVKRASPITFGQPYLANQAQAKDSTLAANLLAWADQKAPRSCLALLNALQAAHFQQGNALTHADDVLPICEKLKLSPPSKALTNAKFTKEAESNIQNMLDLQDLIGTRAIPALLLAIDDNLILLNHNLYLASPSSIVEAISLELKPNE